MYNARISKGSRGFTMIEAVVVIAVVSVMSALAATCVRDVFWRAHLIQLTTLQQQIWVAMEAGMGDLEQRGYENLMDTLGLGWGTTVYAYINKDGASSNEVIKQLSPGLKTGMFKKNQHAYLVWGTECYLHHQSVAVGGGGCMAFASMAFNCKQRLMDGRILWKNTDSNTNGGDPDVMVRYRQPMTETDLLVAGCGPDGELDSGLVENVFDLTPEDGKEVGKDDAVFADEGEGDKGGK